MTVVARGGGRIARAADDARRGRIRIIIDAAMAVTDCCERCTIGAADSHRMIDNDNSVTRLRHFARVDESDVSV